MKACIIVIVASAQEQCNSTSITSKYAYDTKHTHSTMNYLILLLGGLFRIYTSIDVDDKIRAIKRTIIIITTTTNT